MSREYTEECGRCGKSKHVKVYELPTNAFVQCTTGAITTAIWCDECAESNKDLIISDEELRILARKNERS
jgi:hypothetical protein